MVFKIQIYSIDHPSGTYETGNPLDTTGDSQFGAALSGTVSGGTHGHTGGTNNAGIHTHTIDEGEGHSHKVTGFQYDGGTNQNDRAVIVDDDYLSNTSSDAAQGQAKPAFTGIEIENNGEHNHTVTITNDGIQGDHSHTLDSNAEADIFHTHGVRGRSGNALGNHNHIADNTGSGLGHENRPPYYALCYIIQFK